jgi:hypothetical protein
MQLQWEWWGKTEMNGKNTYSHNSSETVVTWNVNLVFS